MQAARPRTTVYVNPDTAGLAAGAALLASHATRRTPAPLGLDRPDTAALPDLTAYRAAWRDSLTMETQP